MTEVYYKGKKVAEIFFNRLGEEWVTITLKFEGGGGTQLGYFREEV